MRTSDYSEILTQTANLCGLDPLNLSADEFSKLRTYHSNRLASAYEFHFWPEVMRVEERWFRDAYDNTKTYAAGDEVYYSAEDAYYVALQASTGNLPTSTTYWGTPSPFDRYIAFEQTGKTKIGQPIGVFSKNPRIYETYTEKDWHVSENGVQVTDSVTSTWLEYRVRPPELKGDSYSGTAAYRVGDQVYFSSDTIPGNFYECLVATTAEQSPGTTPASWSKVEIPYIFGRYLAQGAYADYLTGDQRNESKSNEELFATELLTNQVSILVGQEGQRRRTVVLTR